MQLAASPWQIGYMETGIGLVTANLTEAVRVMALTSQWAATYDERALCLLLVCRR